MNALTKRMTVPEFFAFAQAEAEGGRKPRLELIEGQPVAMASEALRHVTAKGAAFVALREAVDAAGLPCLVVTDGATVVIDDATAYEPDAAVQCGAPVDFDALTLDAPTILVEVISPSSAEKDSVRKLADYFRLASVRQYLIVDPLARLVVQHARPEPGGPIFTTTARPGDRLTLDPPGLTIEVAALFESLPPG